MTGTARIFPWFDAPATGADTMDAQALAAAINNLDAISPAHRTDAMRILATRYRDDLVKMAREDAEGRAGR